jgi:hypothetical protein
MCRLPVNLGASSSWEPHVLPRPVQELLYLSWDCVIVTPGRKTMLPSYTRQVTFTVSCVSMLQTQRFDQQVWIISEYDSVRLRSASSAWSRYHSPDNWNGVVLWIPGLLWPSVACQGEGFCLRRHKTAKQIKSNIIHFRLFITVYLLSISLYLLSTTYNCYP